jgi:hypothetical protein
MILVSKNYHCSIAKKWLFVNDFRALSIYALYYDYLANVAWITVQAREISRPETSPEC